MSRTLTAMVIPPQTTYCTKDGVPYRSDSDGIVHVEQRHVTELTTRGLSVATTAQLAAAHHGGVALVITAENTIDHG